MTTKDLTNGCNTNAQICTRLLLHSINRGRPAIDRVKSIYRIGHSVSSVYVYEDNPSAKEEYYFDKDSNDYSWDCTPGTDVGDIIDLAGNAKARPARNSASIIFSILII